MCGERSEALESFNRNPAENWKVNQLLNPVL